MNSKQDYVLSRCRSKNQAWFKGLEQGFLEISKDQMITSHNLRVSNEEQLILRIVSKITYNLSKFLASSQISFKLGKIFHPSS